MYVFSNTELETLSKQRMKLYADYGIRRWRIDLLNVPRGVVPTELCLGDKHASLPQVTDID